MVGAVWSMAPEMVEQQESYNEKVDVWALGIFCFELTNGEPPNFADDENQSKNSMPS